MEKKLFKNEFIMAPIKLGYCIQKDGKVNEKHLSFYEKRATNLGAVISEPFYIDSFLRENPFQLGIDSDDKLEGISKIASIIHSYGSKFIVHINHPGRMANSSIPGNYFWSASSIPCENGGAIPEAMDETMMNIAIEKMVNASIRAQKINADYIELQFGYGYLLSQFLSSQTNKRNDEYGDSFENRLRFPIRVLKAIQNNLSIPVIARLSATDFQPNGITLEESILLAKRLQEEGVVAIHVTVGSVCSTPAWYYQHMFTQKGKSWELADIIQKQLQIPVIFNGRIHSIEDINFLKEKYNAKYFSIGRALVADENFIEKILRINSEPIRPCLVCNEGCLGGVRSGKGLGCVVNPNVNNDFPEVKVTTKPRKIAIVGAGLAGLEASIILKRAGHNVVLFEKNEIGGQFQLAYLPPKKESLIEIIEFYKKELLRLKIPVEYIEVTNDLLKEKGFEEVIMATGAEAILPPIKGLKNFFGADILKNTEFFHHKKIVIIGGGLIGVEVASKLLDYQNQVIIVEMLDEIARGLEMIERTMILSMFKQHKVQVLLKSKVIEISDSTVFIEDENKEIIKIDNVDIVVVAVGMKPYIPFIPSLPAYYIGDAKKVSKAQDAIKDAHELALKLCEDYSNEESIIFGPVPSRRLGKSLGINNIPFKMCSYSCIYCQIGNAGNLQVKRSVFYRPENIINEVKERLKIIPEKDLPDYLTIVPDGEPTLDINLSELITKLKLLNYPIAIITNGSLLFEKGVQNDLLNADYVSIKVDSVSSNIWKKLNRPHKSLSLELILQGIVEFRNRFKGKLVTETMLIKGLNDMQEEIESISVYLQNINPEIAYLSIPTRPTALKNLDTIDEKTITMAFEVFKQHKLNTELLIGYEGNAFTSSGNFINDLLSITSVHPMREDAVFEIMKRSNGTEQDLNFIIETGQVERINFNNYNYYLRKFKRQKNEK